MIETVYLSGKFLLRNEAKISPDDRGFIFADGVYEVVKYYHGKAFRFDSHLDRLKRSLTEISLKFDVDKLAGIFQSLLEKNNLTGKHAGVYCQITRGANTRIHSFPPNPSPTIYAFAFELPSFKDKLEEGIKVITHEDIRWLRCDIKSVSLLPNTMLYNQAVEQGAGECILIRDGFVTEATHSSLLAVRNGQVYTHPLNNKVLPGITRKVVQEICRNTNIDFIEEAFSKGALLEMDELFIAGTGSEIMPVVQVDGTIIGNGKPGGTTQKIQQEFFRLI